MPSLHKTIATESSNLTSKVHQPVATELDPGAAPMSWLLVLSAALVEYLDTCGSVTETCKGKLGHLSRCPILPHTVYYI